MGLLPPYRWLSYIPKHKGHLLPVVTPSRDPVDRKVTYAPPQSEAYDPRWLLAGRVDLATGERKLYRIDKKLHINPP